MLRGGKAFYNLYLYMMIREIDIDNSLRSENEKNI